MTAKRILCSKKIRKIPPHFSWLDHRLVREGHISRCSHLALALYLFLVTVSDTEGLSYYSDKSLSRLLNMEWNDLGRARRELCKAGLIAYVRPLYQVLALDVPDATEHASSQSGSTPSDNGAVLIGDILRQMGGRS